VLLDDLFPDPASFAAGTGWKIETRGACKGELCVPLPPNALDGDRVDAAAVAGRLGMALVEAEGGGRWAIGPESFSGTALATVAAPDLVLETFDGAPFALSSLRGTRHVLVAWAPY
jgi:hypothetical protein